MSVPVLPHLLDPSLRSLLAAAVVYLAAGVGFFAVTGVDLPEHLRSTRREDFGRSRSCTAWALVVLAVVVLLWPAAPVLRAARTPWVRSRLTALSALVSTGIARLVPRRVDPVPDAVGLQQALADTREADLDDLDARPDFTAAIHRVRAACEAERLVDAVFLASALVDDVTRTCGPESSPAVDALELLAHVAHLVGDDTRSVQLYVQVAARRAWNFGIDHPGARTAVRNAHAVWLTASDQAALRTGILLLPYVRWFAGELAPVTVAGEHRLRELQAAVSCQQP
ncbi:hypothetical protein [Streptacidiphilus sp. EB129]|uniref:hypothetical protein n=1 Tax=Streptacidiphilus sp. EB129 TaxID=3156262 RepID=UPI0035124D2B